MRTCLLDLSAYRLLLPVRSNSTSTSNGGFLFGEAAVVFQG
ncbi:MAG: hypothetical protein Q7I99_01665 [Acholeplasmataceae bacterium]|nr:hypothetical protein [Acholeplasmataceae bacterium]